MAVLCNALPAAFLDIILLKSIWMIVSSSSQLNWTSGEIFRKMDGVDFSGSEIETMTGVDSLGVCIIACRGRDECKSATNNRADKTCKLSSYDLWEPGSSVSESARSSYVSMEMEATWKLAFRATKGINVSAYEAWEQTGHHDDDLDSASGIPVGCYSLDGRLPCDRHFRSKFLDDWPNVQEAKFGFYTNGEEVFSVTFNAAGNYFAVLTFKMERIIRSTIPELVGYSDVYHKVTIPGFPTCQRRFYFSKVQDRCHTDSGWMFVSDDPRASCCNYETKYASFPQFLYSRTDSFSLHDGPDFVTADVFAVHVKT